MCKPRGGVFPGAICARVLIVSLVFLNGLQATKLAAQEAQPQTEQQMRAREVLNQGVQSSKNGQYDDAIAAFERARQLDPRLLDAQLYLARAYADQYIPGAPGEENQALAHKAVEQFRGVLEKDPQNISALDGVGAILYQAAGTPFDPSKLEESKSFHQRHIQTRSSDPEPHYWVGVIDWTLAFRANLELRERYNQAHLANQVRDTEPLPPDAREEYVRDCGAVIEEGMASLKQAIELRPDYDDAMAYLNLIYRRKADIVNDQEERDELLQMADRLVDKVVEIKKKRAEQPTPP